MTPERERLDTGRLDGQERPTDPPRPEKLRYESVEAYLRRRAEAAWETRYRPLAETRGKGPAGETCADCVYRRVIPGRFGMPACGHGGTHEPMATSGDRACLHWVRWAK